MGISPIGQRLYVAEFGPMAVASLSAKAGAPRRRSSAVTSLPSWLWETHKGWVYTGDLTGAVYRAKP